MQVNPCSLRLAASALFMCTAVSAASIPPHQGLLKKGDILQADSDSIQIRVGDEVHQWGLSSANNPDIFGAPIPPNEKRRVCYTSNLNSLCRYLRRGDSIDLVIHSNGKDYPQRLVGVPLSSNFDKAYQAAHRGLIDVSIPEVYELVNIAIAMAPLNLEENQRYIQTRTKYYSEVKDRFSEFSNHPFVLSINNEIKTGHYYDMKMNSYSYEFMRGRIVKKPEYDRTGFPDHYANELDKFVPLMENFARVSGFREFYKDHKSFYHSQEDYFRNDIGLSHMIDWLRKQFPSVRAYDGYKVVFSPLIGGNQSVTWLESNGYREAQAHVDFPYLRKNDADTLPAEAWPLKRGEIVFTELNHAFINPTADRYAAQIDRAIGDRAFWTVPNTESDGYPKDLTVFEELMNWALVALYVDDNAPRTAKEPLEAALDRFMGEKGRGFQHFAAFKAALLDLYRKRPAGATVESLYPQIISWCQGYRVRMESSAGAGRTPTTS